MKSNEVRKSRGKYFMEHTGGSMVIPIEVLFDELLARRLRCEPMGDLADSEVSEESVEEKLLRRDFSRRRVLLSKLLRCVEAERGVGDFTCITLPP
jgi:hypothetical protein